MNLEFVALTFNQGLKCWSHKGLPGRLIFDNGMPIFQRLAEVRLDVIRDVISPSDGRNATEHRKSTKLVVAIFVAVWRKKIHTEL